MPRTLIAAALLALTAPGIAVIAPAPAAAAIGDISTISGTGTPGTSPNGAALGAQLTAPVTARETPDGGYLIVEETGNRVRKVSASGQITTVAGTGTAGFSGDGGAATAAKLDTPHGAIQFADGSILIADSQNYRIRLVSSAGIITTVAGNGTVGSSGDGGAATAAAINYPYDFALGLSGSILVAETGGNRIRRITSGGIISTVAGTGAPGFSGDGGTASSAQINQPTGVAALPFGAFLIADNGNKRIRKVAFDTEISTVAGGGAASPGDGGAATAALLGEAVRVAVMPDGGFVFAEGLGHRVRRVAPDGKLSTIAGTGTAGFTGDGGPGSAARVNRPIGVGVASDGDVLIAD